MHGVATILIVAVSAILEQGCSSTKSKYVTAINQPSALKLTARYVSGEKAVRVRRKDGPAIIDFYMSDHLPRVSSTKISKTIKVFDFRYFEKYNIRDWMKVFATMTSNKCPSLGVELDAVRADAAIIHVSADQTDKGMININIRDTINNRLVQLLVYQPMGTTDFMRICVNTWNTASLTKLAVEICDVRDKLMNELSKEHPFNANLIGHRLSRKSTKTQSETPKAGN